MSTVREVQGDPFEFWDEFSWSELSKAEQELFDILGWNEASWEEEIDPPDSIDKYWKELSDAELKAAKRLGYSEELWDLEDEEEE